MLATVINSHFGYSESRRTCHEYTFLFFSDAPKIIAVNMAKDQNENAKTDEEEHHHEPGPDARR